MTLSDTPEITPSDTPSRAPTRTHSISHSYSHSISQQHATSAVDAAAAAEQAVVALRERQIGEPEQFLEVASPEGILGACRWYDAQAGRVGTGVLVAELRAGGKPGWLPKRSMAAQQDEYAASIVAWLWKNFPGLCDERWGPHPAAIAEVIRLHWRHGKGRLTKTEHGPAIRAAVKRFDAEHGTGVKA